MKKDGSRILITGGAGFVGRNLAEYFSARSVTFIADLTEPGNGARNVPWYIMDVRDEASVRNVLDETGPDTVIHAAANKNVRWCESHPGEAMAVNAEGTRNVAAWCRRHGARMVYISTDLVFDSRRGMYRESDVPQPETVYGRTKLEGERNAVNETPDLVICRSGGIYGRYSPLLLWLRDNLARGRTVDCFSDVYNTPTYAVNLAEMIESILDRGLGGVFHTVGSERVNRYELFYSFAETFGYDVSRLVPVKAGQGMEEMLLMPDASLEVGRIVSEAQAVPDSPGKGMARLLDAGGLE